ncbi:MAG: P-loop NTPase [candidate division WOR-3 bacterium]
MVKTVCVCSVKGGVGKTLISINVAHKLKEMGHSVGLIDSDWDNPNFAQFTNTRAEISVDPKKGFTPYDWNGIQVFSMSFIAGREKSISMTGSRYWQLIDDVVRMSSWDCEYFVVDMPSGSGDAFKSAIHVFSNDLIGNIIVSQPSMLDASKRILNLHKYFEIPVIGIIENMSYFVCPHHDPPMIYNIFGTSVVDELSKEFGVEVLGRLPVFVDLSEKLKNGDPIIRGEGAEVIENACKKILSMPVMKEGWVSRFKNKVLESIKQEVEKILAYLIVSVNKNISIGSIKAETGFNEERPIRLVIVDDSMSKELTSVVFKVKGDKLVVLAPPYPKIDFEIIGSFRTFARMIMRKRKLSDGTVVPFDPMDAWLNGDVVTIGVGYSTKATHAFRSIFNNQKLMDEISQKYGAILERWI